MFNPQRINLNGQYKLSGTISTWNRGFGFIPVDALDPETLDVVGYRDVFAHVRVIKTPTLFKPGENLTDRLVENVVLIKDDEKPWHVESCTIVIKETVWTLHPDRCVALSNLIEGNVGKVTLYVLDDSPFGIPWHHHPRLNEAKLTSLLSLGCEPEMITAIRKRAAR